MFLPILFCITAAFLNVVAGFSAFAAPPVAYSKKPNSDNPLTKPP